MSNPKNKNNLSWEEEKELFQLMQEGDSDARDTLIKSYMPYAENTAKKFAKKFHYDSKEHIDNFTGAAYLGLLNSLKKWDANKGQLSSYVYPYLLETITNEMWNINPISISNSEENKNYLRLRKNVKKIITAQEEFLSIGIEQPDTSQLAEKANISISKAKEAIDYLNISYVPGCKSSNVKDNKANDLDSNEDENKDEIKHNNERKWEFSEEDIGIIYPRISEFLINKWSKEDPARHNQFKLKKKSPARCIMRRNVFLNGSHGKLDVSKLKELYNNVSGSEAYDRRKLWKDYSRY